MVLNPDGAGWGFTWLSPAGESRRETRPLRTGRPSNTAPVPAMRAAQSAAGSGDVWGVVDHPGGKLALRTGRRVVGERPTFPGASLLLSRADGSGWVDLLYADDVPDRELFAADFVVWGNELAAAWIVADGRGGAECRALILSLPVKPARADGWKRYPDFPLVPGVAAPIAGIHGGQLIAAGGANFPDRPPWENGVKRIYDEIHVLAPGAKAWHSGGRLPAPRAYAAVVSTPDGVLAIGGENAEGVFADSLWLTWTGREVAVKPAPALPVPLASPVATVLDGQVYVAGGYAAGTPRVSTKSFYRLDLANPDAGWQALPPWPGPSRALAVIAALNGAIYLISGLEMTAGANGQAQLNYLTDAYRYRPGTGWEQLPDLPWSVIAAPSPAPVTTAPERVFMFGGVDGRQVGKMPRDKRVPEDILYFDVARHQWLLWKEVWPEPVVSTPGLRVGAEWVFVSGETKAGHRTTAVVGWQPA